MYQYITFTGNVKLRSFSFITFDLGGHLTSNHHLHHLKHCFRLDYNVSKYCYNLKMTFNSPRGHLQIHHFNCCRSREKFLLLNFLLKNTFIIIIFE